MNDELQKQLAVLLNNLQGAATSATQWGAAQIPPLVAEKIAFGRVWETWSTLGCLFISIITLLLVLFVAIPGYRAVTADSARYHRDEETPYVVTGVFAGILSVATFIGFLVNMNDFLLVWFAPRLYIVEWLKTLVTK